MSRIQNALKHAEESRGAPLNAQQLDDEVRRLEASINAWRAQSSVPDAPSSSAAAPASPASSAKQMEEEIRRCQGELNAREARVMQAQQQRLSFRAQTAEQERVVAQAAGHLESLRQHLQQAEAGIKQAEADRAAQSERLAALRRCQELADAAAQSERELQTHADAMARIVRVQQRVAQKLSLHQLQAQQLRRANSELRRKLNEALGRATEGSSDKHDTSSGADTYE